MERNQGFKEPFNGSPSRSFNDNIVVQKVWPQYQKIQFMLNLFFSFWYLSFFLQCKSFANMLKKGNLMSYVAERRRRKSVSEQWTLLAQIILRAKWSLIFIRIYWFCDDLTPQSMWSAKEVNGGLFIQTKGTIAWVQILKTNSKWHHIESWHKS